MAIVGDVDAEPRAERAALSSTAGLPAARSARCRPAASTVRRQQVIHVPDKSQSDIAYGFTSIAGSIRRTDAYWVMNNILGQFGLGGRLAENIRERQGMAYYAFSSFDPSLGPDRSSFAPASIPRTSSARSRRSTPRSARSARDGATERSSRETRQFLIGSIPRMLETNQSIATFLQTAEFFGLGLDYDRRLPALLRAVTLEDVNAAAASVLDPSARASPLPDRRLGRALRRCARRGYDDHSAVFFDVDFTLIHPGADVPGHGYARRARGTA